MGTIKVILENGATIEGTGETIKEILSLMGEYKDKVLFYNSSSRGTILISEMETTHLRNAILKGYKEWVDSLHKIFDVRELLSQFANGCEDPTWLALVEEYSTRG